MANTVVSLGFGFFKNSAVSFFLQAVFRIQRQPAGRMWLSYKSFFVFVFFVFFLHRQNTETRIQGQGKRWGLLAGANQSAAQLVTSDSNIT